MVIFCHREHQLLSFCLHAAIEHLEARYFFHQIIPRHHQLAAASLAFAGLDRRHCLFRAHTVDRHFGGLGSGFHPRRHHRHTGQGKSACPPVGSPHPFIAICMLVSSLAIARHIFLSKSSISRNSGRASATRDPYHHPRQPRLQESIALAFLPFSRCATSRAELWQPGRYLPTGLRLCRAKRRAGLLPTACISSGYCQPCGLSHGQAK